MLLLAVDVLIYLLSDAITVCVITNLMSSGASLRMTILFYQLQ